MPSITVFISYALPSSPNNEVTKTLTYDLPSTTKVSTLKQSIVTDAEIPSSFGPHTWLILHNNNPIQSAQNDHYLAAAGIDDGDILAAHPQPAEQAQNSPQRAPSADRIEQYRQQMLSNPTLRSQLTRQIPGGEAILNDPAQFQQMMSVIAQREQSAQRAQGLNQPQATDGDISEENQKRILEQIRREKINQELEDIMETNPELMGRVTMLYVNVFVNNVPVKAFVDSGAQATILSPSCADRCNVTHLIDDRWGGLARGVGTAKILGRVHRAPVRIGYDELPCSFTVMEGKDVEMLLGLDMLKRYQACIDLNNNRLVFPGGQYVEFLAESEIPKEFEEDGEAVVEGPGGAGIGAASGAVKPPARLDGTESSGRPTAPPTSFAGPGRTLGSSQSSSSTPAPVPASTPASALPSASTPQPQRRQPHLQQQMPPRPSAPTPARAATTATFPPQDVEALQGLGASREQAMQALASCGGNVDLAAAMIFESDF